MSKPVSLRLLGLVALLILQLPMQVLAQTVAAPDRGKTYVLVLASSDMPVAGAALHLAISALQTRREVHIMLLSDGLNLGRKGATGPEFAPYGASGPSMLTLAMDAGAHVAVCQICLKNQNIGLDAMIDGVVQINAYQLLDLTDAADVVLSFGSVGDGSQMTVPKAPAAAAGAGTLAPHAAEECDPATDVDACM